MQSTGLRFGRGAGALIIAVLLAGCAGVQPPLGAETGAGETAPAPTAPAAAEPAATLLPTQEPTGAAPQAAEPAPAVTPVAPPAAETPLPMPLPEENSIVPGVTRYVLAQTDVNIREAPSTDAPVVGTVFAGQMAAVIGATADGEWWQVVCPLGSDTECFISADPTLTTPADAPTGEKPPPAVDDLGGVVLESLEVLVLESYPVQVHAALSGYLPDACVQIDGIEQMSAGGTIRLRFSTSRTGEMCAQVIRPFNEIVVLDTDGWPAGTYTVAAGDLQARFTLP